MQAYIAFGKLLCRYHCTCASTLMLSCRYWDINRAADFLGAVPGAMKALTGPCRCCERPTTRYARDMVVLGTSGMCPDCWQLESKSCSEENKPYSYTKYHYTDSNVIWDTQEDVIAKILSVGGYTVAPEKLIHALAKQIRVSCPISECMDFQHMLASFLTSGLRVATDHLQLLLSAVQSDACSRVYALLYSVMLCPWECPANAPHAQSFLVVCNVPWCTIKHAYPFLKVHSLKDKTFMSADASEARPYIDCTC